MGNMFGIVGGMGPLAGVNLLRRIIELTNAKADRHHIPIILYSVPQIPDRVAAILGTGRSPFPEILSLVQALARDGVEEIAIACNTAHYWHTELSDQCRVRILNIVDAVAATLRTRKMSGRKIGLLATEGTVAGRIYDRRLEEAGFSISPPTATEYAELFNPGVSAVKAGDLVTGKALLTRAAHCHLERGAQAVILACTELGLVLTDDGISPFIDSTEALARLCVTRWQRQQDDGLGRKI